MKNLMRNTAHSMFGIGMLAIGISAHASSDYPSGPIKLIVPFATGSGSDTAARLLSDSMSQELGATVIVENRPGANGTIGAQYVAKAKPDGYTLLLGSGTTNAANFALYSSSRLGHDASSFDMVGTLSRGIIGLFIPTNAPWASAKEFVAAAQQGKIPNLSCGSGNSITMVACEMFRVTTGIDAVNIPYKSNGQSLNDVVGGQVGFTFSDRTAALPHINSKRLQLLAVSAEQRYANLPDVPTLAEEGVPGMFFSSWTGVFAPAGTPAPVMAKINAAINHWLDSPPAKELYEKAGSSYEKSNLEESATFYHSEVSRWKTYVEKANIKVE